MSALDSTSLTHDLKSLVDLFAIKNTNIIIIMLVKIELDFYGYNYIGWLRSNSFLTINWNCPNTKNGKEHPHNIN